MNRKTAILAALAFSIFLVPPALSQSPPSQPTREDIMRDNLEQRMNNMRNLDALARKQAEAERAGEPKARYYRPELTKELRERMQVAEPLLTSNVGFLDGQSSGIVRLIEQADCSGIRKAEKAAECYQENANIREYANAFSFRERERAVFARSDLALAKGHLVGGRHSVQTILVPLGDADFGGLTAESPEISYLFGFKPAEDAEGMDAQFEELRMGLTVTNFANGSPSGKFTYSKSAKLRPGGVYALRAISYRSPAISPSDKDTDVVVVLKVLETGKDGGATILWRELSRKPGMVMKDEERTEQDGK